MNLHQALKTKNKLVGDLNKVNLQVVANTRWIKGNTPSYNLDELMSKRKGIVDELTKLKLEISKATEPLLGKIFELAELKSLAQMYKNMNLVKGFEYERYSSSTAIEYEVAISEKERDKRVEEMEGRIMKLQDEIDNYNAITKIME